MRPPCVSVDQTLLLWPLCCMPPLRFPARSRLCLFDDDCLYGTCRGGPQHVCSLGCIGGWIVPERFLVVQHEDVGSQEAALGIGLAPIEINNQMEGTRRRRRFCHG